MRKVTNMEMIKERTKALLLAVDIEPYENLPFICSHPFTTSTYTCDKDGTMLNLTNEKDYEKWCNLMFERIDASNNIFSILCLLSSGWYLTFLKFTKDYMSKKDFSEVFANCWVAQENPNGDMNVSLREVVSWFRIANKKALMVESAYEDYLSFTDGLVVYRGVGVGRKPNGLSWTLSKEKAEWFAHRFDTEDEVGYVQKMTIQNKENILAYFCIRGEEEIVVDTFKEKDIEILTE